MTPHQTFTAYVAQQEPALHSPGVTVAEIGIGLGVLAIIITLVAFASVEFHEMKRRRRHRLAVARMRADELALRKLTGKP